MVSERSKLLTESITLKLNAKANQLADSGKEIFNLTAGQLPFKPQSELVELIQTQAQFLKSYQYSPVPGFPELRKKFINHFETTRKVECPDHECLISNGGKHSVFTVLSAMINPGDEVVLLAPYWVSYPHMLNLLGAKVKIVKSELYNNFTPDISDVKAAITDKTKAVILNSPNNPSGVHYSDNWMKEFAGIVEENKNLFVISDEIYFHVNYFDPSPTYYYQHSKETLSRTIIVDGISKAFASTGLRIGTAIMPKEIFAAAKKIQGHTASGANSLIQKALIDFDFENLYKFLEPIKKHLRENSETLEDVMREHDLSPAWYQPLSAFYFLLDFRKSEYFLKGEFNPEDSAPEISEKILESVGVAMVPGGDFGVPHCARISLVNEKQEFKEAITRICQFLSLKI
ncbi:MAG: pyridoxal phosphate-dependent aminotransferase [Bacteriovoracaceae bacterium]